MEKNGDQKEYMKNQCTEGLRPENECMKTQDTSKQSPLRLLWIALGFLFLGLGTVGVALPILPTVPFYMATAFCFAKSSKRLHAWFVETKLYQKHFAVFFPSGKNAQAGRCYNRIENRIMKERNRYERKK